MSKVDAGHGNAESPPVYTLKKGSNTIQISGRSNGFSIDHFQLFSTETCCSTWHAGAYDCEGGPAVTNTAVAPAADAEKETPPEVGELPAGCTVDMNTDYPNFDIGAPVTGVKELAKCAAICAENPSCTYFALTKWGQCCESGIGTCAWC